jgi:hypothetical protein
MGLSNIITGTIIVLLGAVIIFVGNYFNKKIGIIHVVIYFMASFVIFAGILVLLLYDKTSIF